MLTPFDWLRLCSSGTEVIATLQLLDKQPDVFLQETIGPPCSALHAPCERCGIFARSLGDGALSGLDVLSGGEEGADSFEDVTSSSGDLEPIAGASALIRSRYCPACLRVRRTAGHLHHSAVRSVLIWGQLSEVPPLPENAVPLPVHYRHDEQHFLLALPRASLQDWLSDLLLYHGLALRGLLQIVPALPPSSGYTMGDILARLPAFEAMYPADRLRVRFYPVGHIVFNDRTYERADTLTFDAREFLGYLEMASVFRSLLLPEQQQAVFDILKMKNPQELQFHWGRLLNDLSPPARDMLLSWNTRSWSRAQIYLLDKLRAYAKRHFLH